LIINLYFTYYETSRIIIIFRSVLRDECVC